MELRLRFFFSIRFFVRFWFYLFLFLFVFFVRFWMTEPNAHLAPNCLQSLRGCRIRGLAGARPFRTHQARLEGGTPRRRAWKLTNLRMPKRLWPHLFPFMTLVGF